MNVEAVPVSFLHVPLITRFSLTDYLMRCRAPEPQIETNLRDRKKDSQKNLVPPGAAAQQPPCRVNCP